MHSHSNNRGFVTAELAIGIMTAVIVAALLAWLISLVGLQARCDESAARIARFAARNDAASTAKASENVPEGASVEIKKYPDRVLVSVTKDAYLGRLGPVKLEAKMIMPTERGAGD